MIQRNFNKVFKIALLLIIVSVLTYCSEDDNGGTPLPTEGLIVHYPFNGNANDESGNSNNGVITGASLTNDRDNNAQKAYSFDGVDDQIIFPYSNDFNNFPLSFSFWVNFDDLNSAVIGNDVSDNRQSGVWFSIGQSTETMGKIAINYGNGGTPRSSSRKTFIADRVLSTGQWYHIMGIIESLDVLRIAINGTEMEGDFSGTATSFVHQQNDGSIGRVWDPNTFFSGKIDDLRIYNRVLSADEIQLLSQE